MSWFTRWMFRRNHKNMFAFSICIIIFTAHVRQIISHYSWWRHQMETFSALLALCAGNSPVPCEFPAQRPVTRSFHVFFDLWLNKRLSKQSWGWWFETPSRPLRRHRNVWRHNGRDGVSNYQPHDCLLNRLVGRRSKKTSKLRVTGLCAGNSPGTGEFPAQRPPTNTENVSIWWRHHAHGRQGPGDPTYSISGSTIALTTSSGNNELSTC